MPSAAVNATLGTIGGLAAAALIAWPVAIWMEVRKCEKPKYTLLRALGKRGELRLYAPYLMAEVTVKGGNMERALSDGFRQIASFIFGKNVAPDSGSAKVAMTSPVTLEMSSGDSQRIAMTSPVTAEMGAGNEYKISFIMPSKYTKETLPKPLNDAVSIKTMPGRTLAALTWKGKSPREAEVEARKAELLALMDAAGLKALDPSKPHVWQYDPPFQWRWFRTNELLLEVEGGSASS